MKKFLKPPQAVIFSRDMEPIISIDMREWFWDYLFMHGRLTFAVPKPMSNFQYDDEEDKFAHPDRVTIDAVPFDVNGAVGLLLITHDDVNALMLKSAWLPGQQKDLADEKRKAFVHGFVKALYEMRER